MFILMLSREKGIDPESSRGGRWETGVGGGLFGARETCLTLQFPHSHRHLFSWAGGPEGSDLPPSPFPYPAAAPALRCGPVGSQGVAVLLPLADTVADTQLGSSGAAGAGHVSSQRSIK